tara:strand:- start:193 stop:1008 length:816 start_codon:yes stop_codon:yes gene_type:complete
MWDPGSPSESLWDGGRQLTLGNLDETPVAQTRKGWIYELRFPNGKGYVGQTRSWDRRMRAHKCGSGRDDGHLIKRAIRKHGWENVHVSVIETIAVDRLNRAEVQWIARKGTLKPGGYNTTPGGDAQPMDDPEVRARQKRRIGRAMRKPDVRAKKRALWKDPGYRQMQRERRKASASWQQARKDCQNTLESNEKRRMTWARKRAEKVATMGVEEGRAFVDRAMRHALFAAQRASHRIDPVYGRDPVEETRVFWEREIAGYEATVWQRTLASC